MSNEQNNANQQTFPTAHAYIQVSHTDGSFSEIGVNLAPAFGPHHGENEDLSHFEWVSLSEDDIAGSSRLLREALGETDPDA